MAGDQPVDHDDILNKVTGGTGGSGVLESALFLTRLRTLTTGVLGTVVQGRPYSTWTYAGQPSHGLAPGGTPRNPTNATDGALKQASPTGGRKKWLVSLDSYGNVSAFDGVLYDRLADVSGLVANIATLQTINLSVSRYTGTDAIGNVMMVELYATIGSTPATLTVTYVDDAGASQTTSVVIGNATGGSRLPTCVVPIPYVAGGRGVRSVTSVQLSGSTGTAGDFGITIARQIAKVAGQAGIGAGEDLLSGPIPGPVEVKDDACLYVVQSLNGTSAQDVILELKFLES